jgi:hypothetical protein
LASFTSIYFLVLLFSSALVVSVMMFSPSSSTSSSFSPLLTSAFAFPLQQPTEDFLSLSSPPMSNSSSSSSSITPEDIASAAIKDGAVANTNLNQIVFEATDSITIDGSSSKSPSLSSTANTSSSMPTTLTRSNNTTSQSPVISTSNVTGSSLPNIGQTNSSSEQVYQQQQRQEIPSSSSVNSADTNAQNKKPSLPGNTNASSSSSLNSTVFLTRQPTALGSSSSTSSSAPLPSSVTSSVSSTYPTLPNYQANSTAVSIPANNTNSSLITMVSPYTSNNSVLSNSPAAAFLDTNRNPNTDYNYGLSLPSLPEYPNTHQQEQSPAQQNYGIIASPYMSQLRQQQQQQFPQPPLALLPQQTPVQGQEQQQQEQLQQQPPYQLQYPQLQTNLQSPELQVLPQQQQQHLTGQQFTQSIVSAQSSLPASEQVKMSTVEKSLQSSTSEATHSLDGNLNQSSSIPASLSNAINNSIPTLGREAVNPTFRTSSNPETITALQPQQPQQYQSDFLPYQQQYYQYLPQQLQQNQQFSYPSTNLTNIPDGTGLSPSSLSSEGAASILQQLPQQQQLPPPSLLTGIQPSMGASSPDTFIVSAIDKNNGQSIPSGSTVSSQLITLTFAGVDDDGQIMDFQCSYDGQLPYSCISPFTIDNSLVVIPTNIPIVASNNNTHTLLISAVDSSRNVDQTPASFVWTIVGVQGSTETVPGQEPLSYELPLTAPQAELAESTSELWQQPMSEQLAEDIAQESLYSNGNLQDSSNYIPTLPEPAQQVQEWEMNVVE